MSSLQAATFPQKHLRKILRKFYKGPIKSLFISHLSLIFL